MGSGLPSLSSSASQASPRVSPSAFSCPGFGSRGQLSGPGAMARSGTPSPSESSAIGVVAGVGSGFGDGGGGGGGVAGGGVAGGGVETEPVPLEPMALELVESEPIAPEPVPPEPVPPEAVSAERLSPEPLRRGSRVSLGVGPGSEGSGVALAWGDVVLGEGGALRAGVGGPPASSSSRVARPTSGPGSVRSSDATNASTSAAKPSAASNGVNRRTISRLCGASNLLASSAAMRRDSASWALRSSYPANAACAPSRAAVAARACRPIRSASGWARDALSPVKRFSARAPTSWATVPLTVRHASSAQIVGASAVERAMAKASRRASRSRRSALRAVHRLTPRACTATRDDAQARQRLLRASQHARQA